MRQKGDEARIACYCAIILPNQPESVWNAAPHKMIKVSIDGSGVPAIVDCQREGNELASGLRLARANVRPPARDTFFAPSGGRRTATKQSI